MCFESGFDFSIKCEEKKLENRKLNSVFRLVALPSLVERNISNFWLKIDVLSRNQKLYKCNTHLKLWLENYQRFEIIFLGFLFFRSVANFINYFQKIRKSDELFTSFYNFFQLFPFPTLSLTFSKYLQNHWFLADFVFQTRISHNLLTFSKSINIY